MTTCTRCNEADAAGFCCEAHGKQLCHRCYRRTHFVEICMPGCPGCEREGLNPNATVGDRVPKPKPAPLSEKWANMPSAESTSAQLARVTEERDELRLSLAGALEDLRDTRALLAKSLTNGIDHALAQMDSHLLTVDNAWYCAPCLWTSNDRQSHPDHALTPVRVTITRRQTPEN